MTIRPRRSALYMPGSNTRALEKARQLDTDCVILDLEDAVAPDAKGEARSNIANALQESGYGRRELVVRCNDIHSQTGRDDVRALSGLEFDALLLPKVESPEAVLQALHLCREFGVDDRVAIWVMAETPRGVQNIEAIAAADERLAVIVMGTSDLAKDLRVRHSRDRTGFLYALSRCVVAARAEGLDILDGVHLDIGDDEGLLYACESGRDLGFDGKTLIHPRQIATANRVFLPSEEECERARAIIAAWQEAEAQGKGVVVVDGRLVENLHVDEARRSLALAAAAARGE